jgi:hypothetical protein
VKRWILMLLLPAVAPLCMPVPAAAAAEGAERPTDARSLLQAMSKVSGLEARFVERKQLALLKAPLVTEGRIYYTRGGHMARVVEKPIPSTVRIGPTKLEVIDDGGRKDVDLRSRPDIKTFVGSFVHVVAGDYDALADVYKLAFENLTEGGPTGPAGTEGGPTGPAGTEGGPTGLAGCEDAWLLTLEPKSDSLSKLVKKLEIRGHGFQVHTIRVLEAGGDSTEIALSDVDPEREFTAEERKRLFGLAR